MSRSAPLALLPPPPRPSEKLCPLARRHPNGGACAANVEPGQPPGTTDPSVCPHSPCVFINDQCGGGVSATGAAAAQPSQAWSQGANGSIVHSADGKCLTAVSATAHSRLTVAPCTGAATQRWTINAAHQIKLGSLCLDVGVPFGAPNSLLQLFAPCHPESAPANEAFLFDGHLLKTAAPAGGCVDVR